MRICHAGLFAGLLVVPHANAAICTWIGGAANGSWASAANWNNCGGAHATPTDTDALVFPSAAPARTSHNNIDLLDLLSLKLNQPDQFIDGFAITLSQGISANTPSSAASGPAVHLDITLLAPQTFKNIGNWPLLIGGIVNLNGNLLTIDGTYNINLSDTITGSGGITKLGAGVLFLEGPGNDYTGITRIDDGVVSYFATSGLGAIGAGNGTIVASGANLSLMFADTSEHLTLSGIGYPGTGGALASYSDRRADGDIVLAADTAIAANDNGAGNTLAIGGVISGAFTLTKTGDGILRLGNINTYGSSIVSTGTLEVAGAVSAVTVASGATLAGTGMSKKITLQAGGILAPGARGDDLTGEFDATSLSWAAGGNLDFQLGPDAAHADRLVLSGALTKTGLTPHRFTFGDGATPPRTGTAYTLLTFASTIFTVSDFDFVYVGTGPGSSMSGGTFTQSATQLVFTPGVVHSDLIFRNGF